MRIIFLHILFILCFVEAKSQLSITPYISLKSENIISLYPEDFATEYQFRSPKYGIDVSKGLGKNFLLAGGVSYMGYYINYNRSPAKDKLPYIDEAGVLPTMGFSFNARYNIELSKKISLLFTSGLSFNFMLVEKSGIHGIGMYFPLETKPNYKYLMASYAKRTHFTTIQYGFFYDIKLSEMFSILTGPQLNQGLYEFAYASKTEAEVVLHSNTLFYTLENFKEQEKILKTRGGYVEWIVGLKIRISKN